MELPPKPEIEYRTRVGEYGETIQELTPESDLAYSRWLTACNMARLAVNKTEEE